MVLFKPKEKKDELSQISEEKTENKDAFEELFDEL